MKKHHKLSLSLLAVFIVLVSAVQFYSVRPTKELSAASNKASFTVSPASGNFQVSSNVTLGVYISLDNAYNVAIVDFYYNSARFQYLGADFSSSFPVRSANTGTNGYGSYVSLSASNNKGNLRGKKLIANLRFKVRSAGSAYGNFGKTEAILYPTKNYSAKATNGSYSASNPKPPSPPPPKPPTTPPPKPPVAPPPPKPPTTPPPKPGGSPSTPKPTSSTPKKKTTSSRRLATTSKSRAASVVPAASKPSSSGLAISDFKVTDKKYRSATLAWKTNSPSTTKVNYGTSKDDLYFEQKDDKKTTDHKLLLDSKNLKAGSRYYIRITSDDGKGPTTIDGDFYTAFIPVILKVTDDEERPIAEVDVSSGEAGGFTDEKGEVLLELPEGEVVVYAEKGDLQRELSATIEVPKEDNAALQRITLTLSPNSAPITDSRDGKKSGLSVFKIIGIGLLVALGGFGLFVLIMRRRNARKDDYANPLDSQSHTPQHTIPSTPPPVAPPQPTTMHRAPPQLIQTQEPAYAPVSNPELKKHVSLPEMVGRYGVQQSTPRHQPPADSSIPQPLQQAPHSTSGLNQPQQLQQAQGQSSAPPHPLNMSAPTQQPPHHTSLKEMVNVYTPKRNQGTTPVNDLPVAPVQQETHTTTSDHTAPDSHSLEDSHDGTITINHS